MRYNLKKGPQYTLDPRYIELNEKLDPRTFTSNKADTSNPTSTSNSTTTFLYDSRA